MKMLKVSHEYLLEIFCVKCQDMSYTMNICQKYLSNVHLEREGIIVSHSRNFSLYTALAALIYIVYFL